MVMALEDPTYYPKQRNLFEGISFWTWPNLVVALKQCKDLLPASISSSILEKILDCLMVIAKVFCPFELHHSTAFNFLFHYHQSKSIRATTPADKRKLTEVCLICLIEAPFLAKVRITND
ncbi:hypothetical protein ACE6H2_012888 [Prunus campanulata]